MKLCLSSKGVAKLKKKKGEKGGKKYQRGSLIEEVPSRKVSAYRLETSLLLPRSETPGIAHSWSSAPHGALGRAFLLGCEETTPETAVPAGREEEQALMEINGLDRACFSPFSSAGWSLGQSTSGCLSSPFQFPAGQLQYHSIQKSGKFYLPAPCSVSPSPDTSQAACGCSQPWKNNISRVFFL